MNDLSKPTEDGLPNIGHTLADMDIAVRAAIDAIEPSGDYGRMVQLHGWAHTVKQYAGGWLDAAKERFVNCLRAHGTDERPDELQVGDVRFYEGATKTVKAIDNGLIAAAILDATGGDFGKLAECMASNPWKQGQVKTIIGDSKHAELFATEYIADLKTGKPKRGLKAVNTAFMRSVGRGPDEGSDD
jgi:hypothetical protein